MLWNFKSLSSWQPCYLKSAININSEQKWIRPISFCILEKSMFTQSFFKLGFPHDLVYSLSTFRYIIEVEGLKANHKVTLDCALPRLTCDKSWNKGNEKFSLEIYSEWLLPLGKVTKRWYPAKWLRFFLVVQTLSWYAEVTYQCSRDFLIKYKQTVMIFIGVFSRRCQQNMLKFRDPRWLAACYEWLGGKNVWKQGRMPSKPLKRKGQQAHPMLSPHFNKTSE